jgi:hypothetical protein
MEMMPVIEVRPVIDVPISVAIAAAAEDGRGAKAATMDCNTTAPEPAAMERSTAASEAAAMKTAAAETTTVKPATATAETTTSTTTETAAATSMTAVADFGRQAVGCKFR